MADKVTEAIQGHTWPDPAYNPRTVRLRRSDPVSGEPFRCVGCGAVAGDVLDYAVPCSGPGRDRGTVAPVMP